MRKWMCTENSENEPYFTKGNVYEESVEGYLIDDQGDERITVKQMRKHPEDYPDFEEYEEKPKNKYTRTVTSTEIDVYDVLKAFEVTCPATQHAIKKLLAAGQRGQKDLITDLSEAKDSIVRAIELNQNN